MAYTYAKRVTVDHTQVGGSDLTDFPILIYGTFAELKTVGNGGHVQNTQFGAPADFVVAPNPDGSSPYAFEIAAYDPATGAIQCWVKRPSLSASVDAVLYMVYGDAGVTTYQGGDPWGADYEGVYHFFGGFGADSSANHADGTPSGTTTDAGIINDALAFGGGSDEDTITDFPVYSRPMTFEWWEKGADQGDSSYQTIAQGNAFATSFLLYHHAATAETGNVQAISLFTPSGSERCIAFTPDGAWHHFMFAVSSSGGLVAYKDGVSQSITTVTAGNLDPVTTATMRLGNGDAAIPLIASLDEFRFSSVERPGGWATASYNNQKASSTFLTVDAETLVGAMSWGRRVSLMEFGHDSVFFRRTGVARIA